MNFRLAQDGGERGHEKSEKSGEKNGTRRVMVRPRGEGEEEEEEKPGDETMPIMEDAIGVVHNRHSFVR